MTIDEAILILEPSENRPMFLSKPTLILAIQLGIEALKRVKAERIGYETFAPDLLPGETGE